MNRRGWTAAAAALLLLWATPAVAQDGVALAGRLLDSVSAQPIDGATIQIDELKRQTSSAPDGAFRFEALPPGTYHLSVRAAGYASRRTEVAVGTSDLAVEVTADPELHFEESVTVGPGARSPFESYQPTSILAGQELTKGLEPSLGATLEGQPGVASRSFGPASGRPVVRGLDGDRVLILQDGQRIGDLSSQSGDHAVTTNPAAAQRIEVVRGPATLLYGANAIGGLVNVVTDDIATRPVTGATGNVTLDLGSAAGETGAAGSVQVGNGRIALSAGAAGRRTDDVETPLGEVANSQSRSGLGTVGLAWTGDRGYFGGSYGYDDTRYGVPVVDAGTLQLTPRRHALSLRGGVRGMEGAFAELRATLAVRRYRHDELEGDEVGTAFRNDTTELEVMAAHRAVGRLTGSIGGSALDRTFDATGEEAIAPRVGQRGFAAFIFEELTWPHVTLQFGGRLDTVGYEPRGESARRFTNGSGSFGVLFRPAAANDRLTLAASVARASRSPALEELFFYGEHHGNFAFEIGNPDLGSERALGVDVSLRWRGRRASGEITWFRNAIGDFIFRNPVDDAEFHARETEFAARFPDRAAVEAHGHEGDEEAELAIVDFIGADALLQGVEAHGDLQLATGLFAEAGLDYVRGSLRADGSALPRMPPLRVRGGLRWQHGGLQAGGQVVGAAGQDRVASVEEPTDGYTLLKLFASWSFPTGRTLSTITARLDNATDELYRNHLSLIKHLVPEMGRNFKVLYNVRF